MAPISGNGVMTTAWLASLYELRSSMRSSQRSGELQLIKEMVAGPLDRLPAAEEDLGHRQRVLRVHPETTLPM
jgi:hypothetical protein